MIEGGIGLGIGKHIGEASGHATIGAVIGSLMGAGFGLYRWSGVCLGIQNRYMGHEYLWKAMGHAFLSIGGISRWEEISKYDNSGLGGLIGLLIGFRRGWIIGFPVGAIIGWLDYLRFEISSQVLSLVIGGCVGVFAIGLLGGLTGSIIGSISEFGTGQIAVLLIVTISGAVIPMQFNDGSFGAGISGQIRGMLMGAGAAMIITLVLLEFLGARNK